jgi:threonylcarbamoyladenosine tRNA methylthiotransferase MtaB
VTTVGSAFVGCKVSQADGEEALAGLAAAGLSTFAARRDADVVVLHTCCVTAEAERKSRRLARRLATDGRRVLVAGCAAVLHPEQFRGDGLEVVGRPDWAAVAAELRRRSEPPGGSETVDAGGGPAAGGSGDVAVPAGEGAATGARTRFVLKVQDGCRGSCSFCVVRLVRGRPRSTPLGDALAAARAALGGGCGEVVLSGVDLGAWRDGELRLPDLVSALADLPGLARLRLSSLEPRHLDEALLEALAHPRVARHLHVPLQSADDGVLRAMRRPYSWAMYVDAATRMQARLGDCMLSTDVIAGFPAEHEAAFGRTLAALESGLFGRVHVFAFSARPGTAAAELVPLPAALVKERAGRALAAAGAAAGAARRAALGRPAEVLVEDCRDGLWRGYSSEYIRYHLRGTAAPGTLVTAVAGEECEDGVKGRIT